MRNALRFCGLLLALLLFASGLAHAQGATSLYIGNGTNKAITFPTTGNGNIAPSTSVDCTSGCTAGFTSLAIDASGNLWGGDFSNNKIYKLSGTSGNVSASVTVSGASTDLANPYGGACFDPSGNLFLTNNTSTNAILEFSAANLVSGGNIAPTYHASADSNGRGIACDTSGNVYVVSGWPSVYKITSGSTAWEISGSSFTGGPNMAGIAVDSSGNLYVVDQSNSKIDIFNAGVCTSGTCNVAPNYTITASISTPAGITVDSSGNIYVVNYGSNAITVYNSARSLIQTISGGSTTLSSPQWIAPLLISTPTPTPTPAPTPVPHNGIVNLMVQ